MRIDFLPRSTRRRLSRAVVAATALALGASLGVAVEPASAAPGCRVAYTASSWNSGFTANISLTNLGDPLTSWELTFTFPGNQQITSAWNATASQSGPAVTLTNAAYNASVATNGSVAPGFQGTYSGTNAAPSAFALNGAICTGEVSTTPTATPTVSPTASPTTSPTASPPAGAANSMGFIGCSMAENVSQGYVAVGGKRMWGPYGTGGLVVQSWTDPNSSAWQKFDQQASKYGRPSAVWVQVCIFTQGATYDEVKKLVANARQHAAAGAKIYITGQPLYDTGHTCSLAGANGPALTDSLARQAAADATQNVAYPGAFRLHNGEDADGCHANTAGRQSLGHQAVGFWG